MVKGTAGGSAMALKEAEGHRGRARRGAAERARERRDDVDAIVGAVDFDEEDAWSVARMVVAFFVDLLFHWRARAGKIPHAWKRAERGKREDRGERTRRKKGKS